MASPTDKTLAAYQEGVGAYFAGSPVVVADAVAIMLDDIVAHAPDGYVLELGSGPGEALYLEQRGLQVDRTDATPAFVERLHQAVHQATCLEVSAAVVSGSRACKRWGCSPG